MFISREHISEIFDFLDDLEPRNRDGKIDTSNLRRLANVLGDNVTDHQIELMIQGADKEGKGYVVPDDLYQLMVSCTAKMDQKEEEERQRLESGDHSDGSSSPRASKSRRNLGRMKT